MIDRARELHGEDDDRRWHVGARPTEPADFAVASGIFNVKGDIPQDDWRAYVHDTIDILARAGRRGFAFNVLSLSGDPDRRRPDLYYADPVAMLDHCLSRYGRSVALLQDYGLYEFTVDRASSTMIRADGDLRHADRLISIVRRTMQSAG